MIRLETFNKAQLKELVTSGRLETYDFLPITKHRAFSQIKNPRTTEYDVLLTLALEEEKLAGYLGTLPDEICSNQEKIKFAWLSTLYVNENYRGKKIAQQLLEAVFKGYDNKIGITEFTKEAEGLYLKTQKFKYIKPKKGKRFYFLSDLQTFLPPKKSFFKNIKPVLKIVDFSINTTKSLWNNASKKIDIDYKIDQKIDEESADFIQNFSPNSSERTSAELNWVIENPWVLEHQEYEKNYLFSSYSKEFQYFVIKIYTHQKLSTLAILQLRDGHLKIPYLYSKENMDKFLLFLRNFIIEKKIKMLTSYQTELNEELLRKKTIHYLHQKDFERRYFMSNEILQKLPQDYKFSFQDGDGDCIFT